MEECLENDLSQDIFRLAVLLPEFSLPEFSRLNVIVV